MEMYFFTMETSCWRNISHLHIITQFVGFRVETEMILIDAVQLSNSSYLLHLLQSAKQHKGIWQPVEFSDKMTTDA